MMDDSLKYPEIDKLYQHYKGGMYKVLFLSKHTETNEILVNYQSIHFGSYYSRPIDSWNEKTKDNKERFIKILNHGKSKNNHRSYQKRR